MRKFGKGLEFWVKALGTSRSPLGGVLSRTVRTAEEQNAGPGGAVGKYYHIEFSSVFENNDSVVETLVMILESDGQWRMFNYIIRRDD